MQVLRKLREAKTRGPNPDKPQVLLGMETLLRGHAVMIEDDRFSLGRGTPAELQDVYVRLLNRFWPRDGCLRFIVAPSESGPQLMIADVAQAFQFPGSVVSILVDAQGTRPLIDYPTSTLAALCHDDPASSIIFHDANATVLRSSFQTCGSVLGCPLPNEIFVNLIYDQLLYSIVFGELQRRGMTPSGDKFKLIPILFSPDASFAMMFSLMMEIRDDALRARIMRQLNVAHPGELMFFRCSEEEMPARKFSMNSRVVEVATLIAAPILARVGITDPSDLIPPYIETALRENLVGRATANPTHLH